MNVFNALNSANTQAVLLTVPPFPMHRREIRQYVQVRRKMSENTFTSCLQFLKRLGYVERTKDHFGCWTQHFYSDPVKVSLLFEQRVGVRKRWSPYRRTEREQLPPSQKRARPSHCSSTPTLPHSPLS